ncbi:ciliated left-right organizer metallopeptidase-like isoform X1 [Centruroides vittatus]|uniref:ciliated left-right organizer metallopeptidase-like isoform X1 n=1 Tax=Centruroides vittatus TaxID=120091 RepID=UPI003510764C
MRKRRLCCDRLLFMMVLFSVLGCYRQFGYCCEFDDIISNDVVKTFVNYSSKHKRDMNKADISSDFKPIRIHVYYGIMDHGMVAEQTTRLFSIVEKARSKMSQLLSVKQVTGPLLLPREKACDKLWGPHSRNQNKCSSLRQGYVGEFCENKIDYFQIPDDHLDGLNVYNFTSPHPLPLSLPAGNGVQNADYILYVNAQNTHLCQTQDIIAYASYCVLDQNDRPIAGFINFCPFHLKEKHEEERIVMVAIHELFHALGFSQDMFKKFKDCSSIGIPCSEWKRPVITDKHNVNRLSLPTVIKKMQEHFGCDDINFGAPLGTKKNGEIDSHWNSVMLHGSIMSPDLTFADYISVDPISAAVFADSGWYQVNFSNTDGYFWGKGEGCNFAVKETCSALDDNYFCSMTDYRRMKGCDYLHLTESYCHKISQWKKCGIYKPNSTSYCKTAVYTNETISACILLINENKSNSFCGMYKCLENGSLKMFIDDFWMDCPQKTKLTIEYYGEKYNLICPNWGIICSTKFRKNFIENEVSGKLDEIEIEIYFSLTIMDEVLKMGTIEELHIASLKHLQLGSKVDIIPQYSKIVRIEDYYIMKVNVISTNDTLIKSLKEFVMNGKFSFIFKSKLEVSALGMRINESVKEGNEAIEDYLLFIILALIVITIMIIVAIVLGYYRYKKWKPPNN